MMLRTVAGLGLEHHGQPMLLYRPMPQKFFLVFLATVIVTRMLLYAFPLQSPTVGAFRIHHYMYGLIGIPLSVLFHSFGLYAISLALLIDELTFVAMGGKTHDDNYSAVSLAGTAVLVLLVFAFKEQLTDFFLGLTPILSR